MEFQVFATTDNGNGYVTQLPDWDGEEPLKIRVGAFASDVVISVNPAIEELNKEIQ